MLLDRGVKECRVIIPGEYHDSEQIHITDDQHSPYTQFSKSDIMREIEREWMLTLICFRNSNYVRDWTGYMAVHTAFTCPPGTVWAFDENFKVRQV